MLLGDAITLTCSSRGGVPPPTLRWYKVVDGARKELPSERLVHEGITKAELHVEVDASDKNAEYHCEAANFATEAPLNVNTTLTFLRGGQLIDAESTPCIVQTCHPIAVSRANFSSSQIMPI